MQRQPYGLVVESDASGRVDIYVALGSPVVDGFAVSSCYSTPLLELPFEVFDDSSPLDVIDVLSIHLKNYHTS